MGPKPCSLASRLKDRAGDKEETRGVLGDECVPSSTQAVVVGGCKETWGCLGWSQGSRAPRPHIWGSRLILLLSLPQRPATLGFE